METISVSAVPELVQSISRCRSCGGGNLREVLNLGSHAVSDFYDTVSADELYAPLCLIECCDCKLVQLSHSVSRERLYKDYWYHSGTNPTMVAALKELVEDALGRVKLNLASTVLDIGANDGTLLSQYPRGTDTWGFEPSQLYQEACAKGSCVLPGFYPQNRFKWYSEQPRIITSVAMFYDLDDPNRFVAAIKEDLHREGLWVNQMMDVASMTRANAFDNICHEHVAYWSGAQFYRLCWQHNLFLFENQRNTLNGGSLRSLLRHSQHERLVPAWGDYFDEGFVTRVAAQKAACLSFLANCKATHKVVLGYGASTKGNTLLQYYGIDQDLLPAIADRNPDKHGKLTAGAHIPVISEAEMRERKPDYLLILPWHFLDNFLEREAALRASGTRFVVPLPEFRIV